MRLHFGLDFCFEKCLYISYNFFKWKKALSTLRTVSHSDWDGEKNTLLKLYRALDRSKLDYVNFVYGYAQDHILKMATLKIIF